MTTPFSLTFSAVFFAFFAFFVAAIVGHALLIDVRPFFARLAVKQLPGSPALLASR